MKRSPMKRSLPPPRKPAKVIEYTPRPRTPAQPVLVADGKARMVVPVPKAEKAKPGKRTPTVDEQRWMDAIVAYGCVACRIDGNGFVPAAVHHILRGGVRMGHLFTLPLCDPGHHQNSSDKRISRHPWKARFEQRYGSEDHLLSMLRAEIGEIA